jgi:hypothetical protein
MRVEQIPAAKFQCLVYQHAGEGFILAAQHEDGLCAGNLAAAISVYAAFRRDKLR